MTSDNRLPPKLGPSKSDRVAAISRATVSLVPWAGGALSEVVNEFIPNQRLERIEKFLSYLHEEIERRGLMSEKLKTAEAADFIVQGGDQAIRESSDEKVRYLARCVVEGISAEELNKTNERRLLSMISDLDERDFLILHAYATNFRGDTSFRPPQATLGSSDSQRIECQLYEAAVERLERYGLISFTISTDIKTQMPRFNRFSGRPEGYRNITGLGRKILARAGVQIDDTDSDIIFSPSSE